MATTTNVYYVDVDADAGGTGTTNALTGANCAFKSLSIWEAARNADLTTGDGASNYVVEKAICGSAHANHTADTTQITISGWTTSANSYVQVETNSTNRAGCSYSTSKYRLERNGSTGGVLAVEEDFVRIDGLQVYSNVSDNTSRAVYISGGSVGAPSDIRFSNCLARNAGNASYSEGGFVFLDGTITLWNCIAYGSSSASVSAAYYTGGDAFTAYNCVAQSAKYGFWRGAGSATLKNCYASGASGISYSGTITQTNCAASDTSADGTDPLDSVAYDTDTFVNVTAGSEDFHLAADGNSPLQGAGVDTTADWAATATDINGDTRDATWDIGADAWSASQFARPSSDVAGGTFRSILVTAPFGPRVIA